jgi:arylsulfatase A-like enzyme
MLIGCKDSKCPGEKVKKHYRVIDHLSDEHIRRTPFKDIEKRFPFVEEEILQDWQYIRELSGKNLETWAYSTPSPVLGRDDKIPGSEIGLLKDGQEVPYLSAAGPDEASWKWLKTSEELDLDNRDRFHYNRRLKGIALDAAHPFTFEKLLPAGEVVLFLSIDTVDTIKWDGEKKRPVLRISFDDTYEKRFRFNPRKRKLFKIHKKVAAGLYNIKIQIEEPAAVVIKNIRIGSPSDIVLYTRKAGLKKEPPRGRFQLLYYSRNSLRKGEDQAALPEALYLYQLKHRFPTGESEITANPFLIKKKISSGEFTFNALTAPAASEFTIPVKIPPGCRLELGFGILNESEKPPTTGEAITFKVIAETRDGKKILLNETMNLSNEPGFVTKQVDLSLYKNKNLKLSFITESIKPGQPPSYRHVPFWINPVLYQPAKRDDMNIILISLDTVRPGYLGCYGCAQDTSPAIDALSRDAVLFLNAYSTTSWTLPAHISLLTSLDCLSHRVYYPYEKMDPEHVTLASILRRSRFFSGAVTGGGFLSSTYGFARGFDVYQELKSGKNEGIRSDEAEYLATQSLKFINENKDKAFFLFLHTYQPHDPYSNPSTLGKQFLASGPTRQEVSLVDLFKKTGRFNYKFSKAEKKNIAALYRGEIRYTDEVYVKPLLDRLKELNIYDRTMIILLSDHGEEFYDHEAWLHDHSLYEEAIRIPLMIKFPFSRDKGKRIKNIVRITDVLPTILHEAGINSDSYEFDGESLLPFIKGEEKKTGAFLCDLAVRGHKAEKIITMNRGRLKLILNEKVVSPYVKKVATKFAGLYIELYDLDKDPGETVNLARQTRYHRVCIEMIKEIRSIYNEARRKSAEKNRVHMDKGLQERLRALGYLE